MNHYDRQGKPIKDVLMWARLLEDMKYRRIAETKLADGKRISTVWLGLDHRFGAGAPLIFETMVFPPDSWGELDCNRYSTEAEARQGHQAMVKKWRSKLEGPLPRRLTFEEMED